MKYKFPAITHIDQVLPIVKDRPEFIVAEKDGDYTVINYVIASDDTFPPVQSDADAILRECRGLIFRTSTGEVIARRYHKFFNCGEKDETQLGRINFAEPHVILEKLDGSMITPVWTNHGLRWGTKMGVTQVALPVEEFIVDNPEYVTFVNEMKVGQCTPIFEWCSRKQRIVIDYPEDMLVLTAIRHNSSGEYLEYESLVSVGRRYGIPVVKAYEGSAESMEELLAITRGLEDAEGFVVRFADGHMIKVKAELYLRLHKTKENISREKNVIELIVTEKSDDLKGFMLDEDRKKFEVFERDFWRGVAANVVLLNNLNAEGLKYQDRKDFAVEFVQKQERHLQPFLYKMRSALSDPLDLLKDAILKSCSTQAKVDESRWMFNTRWDYQVEL